ncbi:MAG: SpoIIE family protein phosphatase [Eubacterium sp.]|nr:SpoIIE family protein phosphatase [Eubacterium sp.]
MKKSVLKRSNLAFNIIGGVILLLLMFSIIVSFIGVASLTKSYKNAYKNSTRNIAETATLLVNGDNIDLYLENNGNSEEYQQSKTRLDKYCEKIKVSLVYVIKVDTSDYGRFTSVFNSVGKDTPYTPWEIGYQQDTTNDEYKKLYKQIYEENLEYGTVFRTKDLRGAPPHITTLVPVKNSSGDVVSIMCIQRPMGELKEAMRPYLTNIAISTAFLMTMVSLTTAYFIRRRFVTPLRHITEETTRFAKENKKGESLQGISKINEIKTLGNAIDMMESEMLSYIDNLTAVTSEKERIGAELSIASAIQENSVPHIFPPYPHRDDIDIFASMTPAKEVGGDFYNFFLIDDDHIALVMADVSGKGVPAALFMMVTNILIRESARVIKTPSGILTYVNNRICERNAADMFVTVWIGILEISTGKMIASNAGHDDPAVYRKNGEFEFVKSRHGLVVGAMSESRYSDFEIQLGKGDKIFLYTDGVPEATDKDNKMFSLERMLESLNSHRDEKPEGILDGINDDVNKFVGEAPQFDDLTMLCLQLKEENDMKTLTVDATTENLHEVMDFIDSFLEENDCSMKAQTQIDLSVEEIYVNIANYAYGDSVGKAEISISKADDEVMIVFKDGGVEYNPLAKKDPDVTLSAEERNIGGLGIYLVKKNMDSVSYVYENNQNILTLKKAI